MSHLIIVSFKYVALILGIATVARVKVRPLVLWPFVAGCLAVLLLHLYVVFPLQNFGYDYLLFCKVGRDVSAGLDPYAADRFNHHPFLNPPTALPLFAVFALLPSRMTLAIWTGANVLASLALVSLALHALVVQERIDDRSAGNASTEWQLPPSAVAGLAIALTFSDSSLMGFYVGQLNVLVALMVVAALIAQGMKRPVWAGVWLYLATVKVGTMLPFLLLFLRKADRWTWGALAALVLGSCLLTGRLVELPGRIATLVGRIEELSAPGKVNDYSFEGPRTESIIGFESLFYRLGLRDRATIRNVQCVMLTALLIAVGWLIVGGRLPRPAACALVSLFSLVFFYHRDYDTVILALPLAFSSCQSRSAPARRRWVYVAIGLMALAVLYLNAFWLGPLTPMTWAWGAWGQLVRATVLPYATWLTLLAMITLVTCELSSTSRAAVASA
jgi:hypothetical protein